MGRLDGKRAEGVLRGVGDACFQRADTADPDAVSRSVAAAVDHLGALDILVNNAGIGVQARLLDTTLADFDQVMNVNLRGCLLYAQAAYPHLARPPVACPRGTRVPDPTQPSPGRSPWQPTACGQGWLT